MMAFFMFTILVSMACLPAYGSSKVRKLDEGNVREFVLMTTKMTSQAQDFHKSDVQEYLNDHLHKKGFFKSEIKYTIPGFPSQSNTLSLNKEQFIDSILSGQQALQDYEAQTEVIDISISRDGKKATLSTTSIERGLMPVPSEDGQAEHSPVEGSSECGQILMLEDGLIQMYSATCKTDITFMTPF